MEKNAKIVLAVVVVFLVIYLIIWSFKSSPDEPKDDNRTTTTSTVSVTENTTSTSATTTQTTVAVKTTKPSPILSYSDMVKKYEGRRFQLSNNCSQVSPTTFVIKKGEKFVVDNRENKTHIFTFSKQKYSVKPYSYAIFTAQPAGIQIIYCDGVQRAKVNVAQ